MLQEQGCEISRASAPFTVMMPAKKGPRRHDQDEAQRGRRRGRSAPIAKPKPKPKPEPRTFPAGSYVVRMDQPYSRIADALLDYQYWAPNDPQKDIYDDTGWTFGELGNVQVARVTDAKVLDAAHDARRGHGAAPGGVEGAGEVFLINHNADNALVTLRYRFPSAAFEAAEEPFEAAGHKFNRGSFIIRNVRGRRLRPKPPPNWACEPMPWPPRRSVKTHPLRAARIAIMHTWLGTQAEGWWRLEFDRLKIPYDYISTQTVGQEAELRSKYDVIVFPPRRARQRSAIVNGMPMYGNPLPWKVTRSRPIWARPIKPTICARGSAGPGSTACRISCARAGCSSPPAIATNFAVTFGFTPGVSIGAAQQPEGDGIGAAHPRPWMRPAPSSTAIR